MTPLQFAVPLDPLAALAGVLPFLILALVLANMVTRSLAHRNHRTEADADDEEVSRYLPHQVTTILLVLLSFAFMVVEPHGGMVLSVLVVSLFLADFFEFESRRVEARNRLSFERPKSAIVASLVVLLYAGYQSLFVYIKDYWNLVV
jgi:H+/gluconate symporter-like permease